MRRTKNNLAIVENICSGASEIRLHTPVIDTEAVNYLINFLRSKNPEATFSVRLIPDGLMNVQRHPLGHFKELLQYFKKMRRFFTPELNYYTFKGDRIGSDAPIVDRIYVLRGLPHQYNLEKTVEIDLHHKTVQVGPNHSTSTSKKLALVIGQPLIIWKRFSQVDMQSVSMGIRSFIADCGINHIVYKSHPRDPNREFFHPDYEELTINDPLETHLASYRYDLVIGVCSTALLTARMILPQSYRVVAYGMNMMKYRGKEDKMNIELPFQSLGVEMIEHLER